MNSHKIVDSTKKMTITFHPEANQIKEILDTCGIQNLYHFTSVDNLPIISKCGGLWGKEKLEKKGLFDKIITGGNDLSLQLDRDFGDWDKVHLYFCPHTPMAYRIQENSENRYLQSSHICYLVIDPIVALWDGVFFTDINATKKGHQKDQGLRGLKLVDFNIIKNTLSTGPRPWEQIWHRNVQAECLVPNEVPLKFVKNITFISNASLKEGKRLWGDKPHPSFKVDKNLFHCGFPYVKDAILTSKEVNKDNINFENFSDMREFILSKDSKITMLVSLRIVPGLQNKTIWRDNNDKEIHRNSIEFDKEGDYWHWPTIEIKKLSIGRYSIEYYIKDTRWIKILFTIRR